ncbi:MAG: hypothetical protein K0R57_3918 [Paenibacillaceae bacterium]|jgi:uncharacterized protein (DUF342 family)|nr:hypothetical protein [Paenibacillaceae bacterium]
MKLFSDISFHLWSENNKVFIQVTEPGLTIKNLDSVLAGIPRLQLTSFANLRSALHEASNQAIEIGVMKPLVQIAVDKDFMEATVRLHMTEDELKEMKSEELFISIVTQLDALGVKAGILYDILHGPLAVQTDIVIAQGIPPIHGLDAEVRLFSLSARTPVIREDGSANYYELNFIDLVHPGDWLGEKIPPTEGTEGRNLAGGILSARNGRDKALLYDKKSISLHEEEGKVVLRSRITGVVVKEGRQILVEEILRIHGDVGPKTGNINYEGSVEISGTVLDGYSVIATKDISILGEEGIGAVEQIISSEGDIFIKGGIFGKDRALIRAGGQIYVKHAKDCTLEVGGHAHIGLYAINCNIKAEFVHLDETRGKIIGGDIQAQVQLVTAYIGNESERPTKVVIKGFDRNSIMQQLDSLLLEYKEALADLDRVTREELYEEYIDMLVHSQKKEDIDYAIRYDLAAARVFRLEEQRKKLMIYMKAKGDGEISVLRKAYPRTQLKIKNWDKRIEQATTGSFYVQKNTLFHE